MGDRVPLIQLVARQFPVREALRPIRKTKRALIRAWVRGTEAHRHRRGRGARAACVAAAL